MAPAPSRQIWASRRTTFDIEVSLLSRSVPEAVRRRDDIHFDRHRDTKALDIPMPSRTSTLCRPSMAKDSAAMASAMASVTTGFVSF